MNETYERVVFFNNCNNGDMHFSRQFVKYFASKFTLPCFVSHFRCPSLLRDTLPYIRENTESLLALPLTIHNNTLYVNTWIGNNKHKWYILGKGCSLKGNYKMYEEYGNSLGISLPEEHEFIPEIDYSKYQIGNVNPQNPKSIFFSNGSCLSRQGKNYDADELIIHLARKYKDCDFYVTQKINTDVKNVIDANSLFDTGGHSNLNELSYLSTFCKIIVGRSSGPYSFAHTKENLLDSSKTFVVTSNSEREGHWALMNEYQIPNKAKQKWIECHVDKNTDCVHELKRVLEEEIDEKFGNR